MRNVSLRLLLLLNVLALAFSWAYAIAAFPHLGTHIPTHFGFSGAPDQFSSSASTIFAVPGVGTGIFVLIAGIGFGLAALGVRPNMYGRRLADSAQNQEIWRVMQAQLLLLNLPILLTFDYLTVGTALIAQGYLTALSPWWLPVFLIVIFAQSINMIVQLMRTTSVRKP
jgi:uncharacterized membrane protein